MQKVEGSNPFSRFPKPRPRAGFRHSGGWDDGRRSSMRGLRSSVRSYFLQGESRFEQCLEDTFEECLAGFVVNDLSRPKAFLPWL